MEKNIKELIERMEAKFGIDLQSIIQDETMSIEEKRERFHKTLLSAKLKSIQKENKAATISANFDVDEFVNNSKASASGDALAAENWGASKFTQLPIISVLPDVAKTLSGMSNSEVKEYVEKLFRMSGELMDNATDETSFAVMMVEFGVLAVSLVAVGGMGVALGAAIAATVLSGGSAAFIVAAAVGVAAAGLIACIDAIIMIISTFVLPDRSFHGLLINNTKCDLFVEEYSVDVGESNKDKGIYLNHGTAEALMWNKEPIDNTVIQENPVNIPQMTFEGETHILSHIGLFTFSKLRSTYGSEGIIRFNFSNQRLDLSAACPLSNDNRMMLSVKPEFTKKSLGDSNVALWKEWDRVEKGNMLQYKEKATGITLTSAVSDLRNSPAYGIATVTSDIAFADAAE